MIKDAVIANLLLIDIETIPQAPGYSELSADWKTLWWDKISKTVPENTTPDEAYEQKAGILAEFGKVICISTAYFFENEEGRISLKMKSVSGDDERAVLLDFIAITDKFYKHNNQLQFAGHNVKEFDIPFLCRRMIVNNVPLPSYLQLHAAKPWEVRIVDTLQWWKFGDYKNYISLHLLANVLGIPTSKTDMDGSMVKDVYYKEKDLPRIVDYCQRDVVVVGNVVLKFRNMGLLRDEDVIVV